MRRLRSSEGRRARAEAADVVARERGHVPSRFDNWYTSNFTRAVASLRGRSRRGPALSLHRTRFGEPRAQPCPPPAPLSAVLGGTSAAPPPDPRSRGAGPSPRPIDRLDSERLPRVGAAPPIGLAAQPAPPAPQATPPPSPPGVLPSGEPMRPPPLINRGTPHQAPPPLRGHRTAATPTAGLERRLQTFLG